MGKAPAKLTKADIAAPVLAPPGQAFSQGHSHAHGHGHAHGDHTTSCPHHHADASGLPGAESGRRGGGSASVVAEYGGAGSTAVNGQLEKRRDLQERVFQPHWRQPTESLDSYVDRMMPHAVQGGGNDPNLPENEEEEDKQQIEIDEREDRDDQEYLDYQRYWDEFKDDNPTGSGNTIGQG